MLTSNITCVMLFVVSLLASAESYHSVDPKKLTPLILTDYHYLEEVDLQSLPVYQLIQSSFSELGFIPQIRYLPGRRALAQVLSGEADGALALTLRSKIRNSSLQLVDVPISNMSFYRYWNESEHAPAPYCLSRIGAFRGHDGLVDIADQEAGCTTPTERVYVTRPKQLMAILAADRVDYVLSPLLLSEVIQGHYKLLVDQGGQNLVRQSVPFVRMDLYMYLAEKNVHLVPAVENEFRQYMTEHNYKLTIEDQFKLRAQRQIAK